MFEPKATAPHLDSTDHVFREEYQPGKQAVESHQEEKHERDGKHFAPPGLWSNFGMKYRTRACQAIDVRQAASVFGLVLISRISAK
jgi:hypothetical protein